MSQFAFDKLRVVKHCDKRDNNDGAFHMRAVNIRCFLYHNMLMICGVRFNQKLAKFAKRACYGVQRGIFAVNNLKFKIAKTSQKAIKVSDLVVFSVTMSPLSVVRFQSAYRDICVVFGEKRLSIASLAKLFLITFTELRRLFFLLCSHFSFVISACMTSPDDDEAYFHSSSIIMLAYM